ncbi:hypothetical protein [Campylobacter aviculae]|uniref:Uncharacterized protein n=1 Tax=Campylobacter aviculae TaxID=2510190 RepID=A0A4U7BH60_9BACT|nr:hypothetical protein [Campylobacter aviculae]TKX29180.1 hypothetical protein CQA76_08430 [Campylobacter aviculae]
MSKKLYDLIWDEAELLMEKLQRKNIKLTKNVFLNFLYGIINKHNQLKTYDLFNSKNTFAFVSKDRKKYIIISYEEEQERKIDLSGFNLKGKDQTFYELKHFYETNYKKINLKDFKK